MNNKLIDKILDILSDKIYSIQGDGDIVTIEIKTEDIGDETVDAVMGMASGTAFDIRQQMLKGIDNITISYDGCDITDNQTYNLHFLIACLCVTCKEIS